VPQPCVRPGAEPYSATVHPPAELIGDDDVAGFVIRNCFGCVMALCDRLEASLTTADDTRSRLLEALLAEALAPDDERELEAAE
jgi:hypothetical protein